MGNGRSQAAGSTKGVVEKMIDQMVESDVQAKDAVSSLLDDGAPTPGSVEIDVDALEEGKDVPCQLCGYPKLEVVTVESKKGEESPALHCPSCDAGFVPQNEDENEKNARGGEQDEGETDGEEPEVKECELDENNPECPACGSDNLDVEMTEHEGDEIPVISCGDCGATMIPAPQDEDGEEGESK